MMEQQGKIKDSPFYVDYPGKIDEHFTITTTDSFKKALAKHLQGKYPNETNPQGKHNFSKCVRLVLENYLNQLCISRKTYDYNIVAIIGDELFGTGEIYLYDVIKDKTDENILFGSSRKLYWANVNENALNERYSYDDLDKISKLADAYKTNFETDGVLVVDLPLNNFFDKYVDGIYTCDAENKGLHCGVNIITTMDKIHCVVYTWYINYDFKPIIDSIAFDDLNRTMQDLMNVNQKAYLNFSKTIKVLEDKYIPKDDVESLKKQKKSMQEQIDKFLDSIDFLQERIDAIDSKLDEQDK